MTRLALLVAWAFLCLLAESSSASAADRVVSYTVAPELLSGAVKSLRVTARMTADPTGTTRIDLPHEDGGAKDLWRHIVALSVDGGQFVTDAEPHVKVIRSRPRAHLVIHYEVASAFDHDPSPAELDTYEPTLLPGWFWIYGEALFIRPEENHAVARFAWTGPTDFKFASNLQDHGGRTMSFSALMQSVAVGGPELRVIQTLVDGHPLRAAMIGEYRFSDGEFEALAARIIRAERAFWRSEQRPFLVVVAPLSPEPYGMSVRGEGRDNAFAIMTTTNVALEVLKPLLAHEYFHTWNPPRLGGLAGGSAERAGYWFSEGFTDYYARKLLLRSNLFSPEEFAAEWNRMLLAYGSSPVQNAPNSRVVSDFWNDEAVEKLPYQRGAMLAAIWDQELRERSGGKHDLDDVVRAMQERALHEPATKGPDLFVEIAKSFGLDVTADLSAYVERGATIELPEDAFGHCFGVIRQTIPTFDRGFDGDATLAKGVVTGLEPGSAAERAGLRNGMTYIERLSGLSGDSRVEFAVRVRDAGVERVIRYYPAGAKTIAFQELVVHQAAAPTAQSKCGADQ